MPTHYQFGTNEFDEHVGEAGRRAFERTLAAGLPVFYVDRDGLRVMEEPGGRRFEIRWIPGAPSGSNYEVLREVGPRTY